MDGAVSKRQKNSDSTPDPVAQPQIGTVPKRFSIVPTSPFEPATTAVEEALILEPGGASAIIWRKPLQHENVQSRPAISLGEQELPEKKYKRMKIR